MFLSRIELDTQRDKTLRAIVTPTMIHAAVEGCFTRHEDGNERKLWRLDPLKGKLYMLLLSPERPNFENFAEQFCPRGVSGEIKDYDSLLAGIDRGQYWRFRLRANPVHSVTEGKGERGKPQAHKTVAHQREWLLKRAEKCGFELRADGFDVVQTDLSKFRRSSQREAQVTIGAVLYEGELTVCDTALFRDALTKGIGRAKAYGCGLLTIARMP